MRIGTRAWITVCFLTLLQTVWVVSEAPGAGVVYRFRPGSPQLSSAHVSQNVEIGPFIDQRELVARGPGGWGLTPPYSAEFDGTSSVMRSDGIDPMNQPLGPKMTVEVWFRASSTDGRTILLTNRAPGGDGFVLGVSDGVPFLELVSGANVFRVDADLSVRAGENRWLAGTILHTGSGFVTLSLYVDGEENAVSQPVAVFASPYVLNTPFYVGTAVEGNPLSPAMVPAFEGHVFSAIVRDYVAHNSYLTSGIPLDGGEYFGLPSYHDYPLDEFHLPMDQRIEGESVEVDRRFFVPYANDEFIPQGTATRIESVDGEEIELVYISYYHRTREGTIETQRSIVAEVEAATGIVRRTFRLRGVLEYSHAGGIAVVGDAFFISSVGFLERYVLPTYEGAAGPKYIDLGPDTSGSISVDSKASFVSVYQDTLWVGDWRPSNDVEPFLYSYPLKSDGRPEPSAAGVYALPRNIQGVDLITHNGQTFVFMARNRNSREAELLRYRREQLHPSLVFTPDSTVTMPFGIEDLSFSSDTSLWTNSESGTVYYQRRDISPWQVFYPFVYSIPAHVILPGAGTVSVAERPKPLGLGFRAYPNPLHDSVRITIEVPKPMPVRVYLVDAQGRYRGLLREGHFSSERESLVWDASDVASGTYFVVVESEVGRLVEPLIVIH